MFDTPSSYDPSKQTGPNLLAPLLNDKGKVVNYRYLMQENTKDELFRRENRVDRVIGTMAASIFDKGNVVGLNNNAIDAIKAQYDADWFLAISFKVKMNGKWITLSSSVTKGIKGFSEEVLLY